MNSFEILVLMYLWASVFLVLIYSMWLYRIASKLWWKNKYLAIIPVFQFWYLYSKLGYKYRDFFLLFVPIINILYIGRLLSVMIKFNKIFWAPAWTVLLYFVPVMNMFYFMWLTYSEPISKKKLKKLWVEFVF